MAGKKKKITENVTSTPDLFVRSKSSKNLFDEENQHLGSEADDLCDFLGVTNLEEGGFSIITDPNFSIVRESMPGNLARI